MHDTGLTMVAGTRRPVRADVDWLMDAVESWPATSAWDLRDRWATPADLAVLLWSDALDCQILEGSGTGNGTGAPDGLIQVVGLDAVNRHATLELIVRPGGEERCGVFVRQVGERVLARHGLRKLCVSGAADRLPSAAAFGGPLARVGCHPAHHRRSRERFVDVLRYELQRGEP